jgi:putative transposase
MGPHQRAPRRVADPTRTVEEQFVVEIAGNKLFSHDPGEAAADLFKLNELFTGWVETAYHRHTHSETGQTPLRRWHDGWDHRPPPRTPATDALREAFLWEERRQVRKTACVSLHGNVFQVDTALVGRRVELVFDPFDMTTIEVRYRGVPHGLAIPHRITRHSHPKARPETGENPPPQPTGIDYLALIAATYQKRYRRTHQLPCPRRPRRRRARAASDSPPDTPCRSR